MFDYLAMTRMTFINWLGFSFVCGVLITTYVFYKIDKGIKNRKEKSYIFYKNDKEKGEINET